MELLDHALLALVAFLMGALVGALAERYRTHVQRPREPAQERPQWEWGD